jgi:hypothetical protein
MGWRYTSPLPQRIFFSERRYVDCTEQYRICVSLVAATIAGNETIASLGVEPLHRAGLLDGYARR